MQVCKVNYWYIADTNSHIVKFQRTYILSYFYAYIISDMITITNDISILHVNTIMEQNLKTRWLTFL